MASGLRLPGVQAAPSREAPRGDLAGPDAPAADGPPGPPLIAGSAMHDRYGGALKRLFEWLFGPIQYPTEAAGRIRELAARGTVIYVARGRSSLVGLYFNHALSRFGLPLASFVAGINLLLWQPVEQLWLLWRQRRRRADGPWRARYETTPTPAEGLLADLTLRGEPSFLFLPPVRRRRYSAPRNNYLRALIAAQRVSARPVFLVPHAVIGRTQSGAVRGALGHRLFGSGHRTGRLRELALVLYADHAAVRVGDPIDLLAFIAETPAAEDLHLARRLAHTLHQRISDEERVIAGPDLPPLDATKRHVLRSPSVRRAVAGVALATKRTAKSLERRAERLLDEIAARYNVTYVRFFALVMSWIFNRIYDGIVVDEQGLGRVIEASRKGPLVFCPSHKSHVDYLVLSYILWARGITPPHIAAGANLAFFPLGSLFRRSGAFFLRRSFKDDELYRAVFEAYTAELVRAGASIEVFVEGTRSRSGKLGMPKFGILSMIVDAWRGGARADVQLVPVSIDYERIIEAGSYERELLGAEKKGEDLGALLRSTRVLRSRYGRVYVQFGEPLSLAQHAESRHLPQSAVREHDGLWHEEVERLGYRVLHGIAQVCTVTPTAVAATALLAHRKRGLAQSSFLRLANAIIDYLYAARARLSETLLDPETRDAALLETVQKLVEDGTVSVGRAGRSDAEPIYRVHEERRILLDFHKNATMNYFAPAALVARALMRRGEGPVPYAELFAETRFLSRLFKREFIYRADAAFETHFDEALASLAVRGLLDVLDDNSVAVREPATIAHLAGLLDSFVEAYWITAQTLTDLRKFPLWDKELAVRARERASRAFLEGQIIRPEAQSRTLIESALGWMQDAGVLVAKSEGRRRRMLLGPAYDGEKLDELIGEIGSYR